MSMVINSNKSAYTLTDGEIDLFVTSSGYTDHDTFYVNIDYKRREKHLYKQRSTSWKTCKDIPKTQQTTTPKTKSSHPINKFCGEKWGKMGKND